MFITKYEYIKINYWIGEVTKMQIWITIFGFLVLCFASLRLCSAK